MIKFENMMFVIGDAWWPFVTQMVGIQEDNSSSLCIIDTDVRNRLNMKIGDMVLELGRGVHIMLIDGGSNTWKIPAEKMIMPTKCL